jgi:hypothetical protein
MFQLYCAFEYIRDGYTLSIPDEVGGFDNDVAKQRK